MCGMTLFVARLAWIMVAIFSLGLFAIAIPYHIIYLSSRLPLDISIALMQLGLPPEAYIVYTITLEILVVVGFTFTALLIFKHKSNDWMTLFVSLALLTFGASITTSEGAVSPLNSLVTYQPALQLPISIQSSLGMGMFLLVLFLFPDGRFVPRWTKPLAVIWLVWLFAWSFTGESHVTMENFSPLSQFILRMLITNTSEIQRMSDNIYHYSIILVMALWFGAGVLAQIIRYTSCSTPIQRHQTKWVVLGIVTASSIYFGSYLIPPLLAPVLQIPTYSHLRYELVFQTLASLSLLLIPISLSVSIRRYGLWDVDFIINRTLVYTGLTLVIGAVYLLEILIIQRLFSKLAGTQSTIFVALSTLAIAALFSPIRRWLQRTVDRRFFREKVSFRQAFTSFAREVRTIIDLEDLLSTLADRTIDMLHIEYGAVYLLDTGEVFHLRQARGLPENAPQAWQVSIEHIARLSAGQVISPRRDPLFPILVPLLAPQTTNAPGKPTTLLGLLALGPLRSGLGYTREDQALLLSLADQAGTAIHVARLIQKAQQESRLRIEAEQRLETHRNSPLGRAESLAQSFIENPDTALQALHTLAQQAGKDPESASLVGNLPQVLANLKVGTLPLLAESFNYLYQSQFTPQLMPIGLKTLNTALEQMQQDEQTFSEPARQEITLARQIYQSCLQAYNANSTVQIMDYIEPCPVMDSDKACCPEWMADLANVLREMRPISDALHAYERVDTTSDKLAYLARAVNGLRHVAHLARVELGSADQPIAEQISENWLAIVTSAMSELQTSARLVCRLLTRNTWHGDVISLALSLQNQGRGAALQIRVGLAPSPDYTLIDEVALVERLAPGEEAQIQLRVHPHLPQGADHFRARFVILYTDPRGPDQVENFADIVHLLATGSEYRFIPNPYVVGTPLKTGSPLFFGREDVVKFIQTNLGALHRNNLVLIGQRRTGKTSLLKQLPARLWDDILPIYLDGQTLGLDPGMPNFFLNLATEITFAIEDRGLAIDPPTLEDFQNSPANVFEHNFLPRVRQLIGDRHLLIMFDEFEELEAAVRRGDLEASIFGFLRHLIQHQSDLSVIFCGTHRLEQLASDYWNVLFNISLYHHIAFLDRQDAQRLIEEPVAAYGMRYDDLALDKIWRVTAGHPYFLQLLCHSLVNHHNQNQRSYVTIADVNSALDEILASGEAHFVYMWTESSPEERLILTALSRMIPHTGQASAVQVSDFFEERGVTIERQIIQTALHRLTLRDILQASPMVSGTDNSMSTGDTYQWKLGLLGLWVEKYKSLNRVIDEDAPRPVAVKEQQ